MILKGIDMIGTMKMITTGDVDIEADHHVAIEIDHKASVVSSYQVHKAAMLVNKIVNPRIVWYMPVHPENYISFSR